MKINISITTPPLFYLGLHDCESEDWDFESRNQKESIPEVTKCGNGEVYPLVEPVEWLWFWSWACRYPSLSQAERR